MNPVPPSLPAPQRPASLTVFGILNLVFGFIGLIGALMSYKLYFTPLEGQTGIMADLLRSDAFYASCMRINVVPSTLFVIAQVISGIGLLQAREGARRTAMFCGVYGIIAGIFMGYLSYSHVMPFTIEYTLKTVQDPAVAEITRATSKVAGLIGLVAGLIYPVLTLVFLGRKKVREFCRTRAGNTPA
jgi:hypothetical protein